MLELNLPESKGEETRGVLYLSARHLEPTCSPSIMPKGKLLAG